MAEALFTDQVSPIITSPHPINPNVGLDRLAEEFAQRITARVRSFLDRFPGCQPFTPAAHDQDAAVSALAERLAALDAQRRDIEKKAAGLFTGLADCGKKSPSLDKTAATLIDAVHGLWLDYYALLVDPATQAADFARHGEWLEKSHRLEREVSALREAEKNRLNDAQGAEKVAVEAWLRAHDEATRNNRMSSLIERSDAVKQAQLAVEAHRGSRPMPTTSLEAVESVRKEIVDCATRRILAVVGG